ncbi:transposase [Streptomyces nodosus]|uniref:transposase n=1 Tax=Streptomyces nodosus TaxID=40318 RepID=UPI0036E66149
MTRGEVEGHGGERSYDAEFRAGAVRIVTETGKSAAEVARDLGVQPSTLQNWIHRARARADAEAAGGLSESERDELRRLREVDPARRQEAFEVLPALPEGGHSHTVLRW